MRLYELLIAFRYVKANFKQSLIIMIAVSVGVSIIIWIPSINLSFMKDLIDKSVSNAPNIVIKKEQDTFKDYLELYQKHFGNESVLLRDQVVIRKRNIKSYREIAKKLEKIDGIEAIAPIAEGQSFLIKGGKETGASVIGIEPKEHVKLIAIEKDMVEGSIRNLGINDIVIGQTLAEKLKLSVENRIKITGPTGVSKNLKITGIFSTGLRGKDEWETYVNLKSAQQVLDIGTEITSIGIKVSDIYKAEEIAREIEPIVKLDVTSWMESNRQILDQLNRFKLIISFINFLIIFSAASSITSIFIMFVTSKSKEIGILKSMGAKNFSVMSIFMLQAVSLSLIGYLLGVVLAKFMVMGYAKMIAAGGHGTIFSSKLPEFEISKTYAGLAFIYTIMTSLLASILPAYQAAKLNPVEAINA